jgi:hypothetical protein
MSGSASFPEGEAVQIGLAQARLRQFQVKGINLVGTQVTNKQTGAVGSEAAPVTADFGDSAILFAFGFRPLPSALYSRAREQE